VEPSAQELLPPILAVAQPANAKSTDKCAGIAPMFERQSLGAQNRPDQASVRPSTQAPMAAEQAKPATPEELALPGLWVCPLRGRVGYTK